MTKGEKPRRVLRWMSNQIGWYPFTPHAMVIIGSTLRMMARYHGRATWSQVERVRRRLNWCKAKINDEPPDLSVPDPYIYRSHQMIDYIVKRGGDRQACWSECKFMYYCGLERGHAGHHQDDVLAWPDSLSRPVKQTLTLVPNHARS